MPKPSFRILLTDYLHPDPNAMRLCIDAGLSHFSLALFRKAEKKVVGFEFYPVNQRSIQTDVLDILNDSPLMSLPFSDVSITYNTSDSVLIPERFDDKTVSKDMLNLIHGDLPTGMIMHEQTGMKGISNHFRVPSWLHTDLVSRFRDVTYSHVYSAMLRIMVARKEEWSATCMHVWFYPGHVIVYLQKNGALQLMQSFVYEVPEDVSYALLNISEQFGLDCLDLPLVASGFLEKDSILYVELMKYFLVVESDNGSGFFSTDAAFSGYPDHFFTPAFSLCICG
jgi:hypothetical protein